MFMVYFKVSFRYLLGESRETHKMFSNDIRCRAPSIIRLKHKCTKLNDEFACSSV